MVAKGLHPLTARKGKSQAGACQVPYRRPQLDGGQAQPAASETGRGTPLDSLMTDDTLRAVGGGLPFPPTGCLAASVGCGAKPHGFASINLIQGNKVGVPHYERLSGQLLSLWKYRPRGINSLDLFHWLAFFRASFSTLRGQHARP